LRRRNPARNMRDIGRTLATDASAMEEDQNKILVFLAPLAA
jgi:hypothetical protein